MTACLRVALHNPFDPRFPFAERELALRMQSALRGKGWDAIIAHRAMEIDAFDPDLVVSLHPQATPKLTRHLTVACHWNPPAIHGAHRTFLQNERSYDGWLTAGDGMRRYVADFVWPTARPLLTAPMYPSSQALALEPTLGPDSRLFYIGSNWDGKRYPVMLSRLAAAGVLALHGRRDRWEHLADAFVEEIPFDGRSVMEKAHRCGLGLCLHLPSHAAAGIPNMRIFELSAAGVLTIADRHPFILEAFGDSVLYVDLSVGEAEAAEQILDRVAWARSHPVQGRAMARAAQAIFLERFSLDVLLEALPALVAQARPELGMERGAGEGVPAPVPVDLVLPVRPGGLPDALARVEAVAGQTAGPVGVVLVLSDEPPDLPRSLSDRLARFTVIRVPVEASAGSRLWMGLRAATAEWVGVLPPGARPFPNHVATLLDAAAALDAAAVHGGALQPVNRDEVLIQELAEPDLIPIGFAAVDTTDPASTAGSLHAATLLVRRERLTPILRRDPELGDSAPAFLAHQVAARCRLGTSGLLTMRVADRAEAGLDAEAQRLERLAALAPLSASAHPARSSTPSVVRSPATVTCFSDLDPGLAERLPRLVEPADFARLPGDRPLYLYGASRGGRLLQLELAKWEHLTVAGFLDGMRKGEAWGLPIAAPEDVAEALGGATVIIASQYVSEIAKRLRPLGLTEPYNAYPFIAQYPQRVADPDGPGCPPGAAAVEDAPEDA